jgi:hypothetical protein
MLAGIILYQLQTQETFTVIPETEILTLVVARYNENLFWLKNEPFNKYPIYCYNKGKNDNFYQPPQMKIIPLPNVGRCDHTYLYHIVHEYNNLSKHVMFLPGSCDIELKYEKAKRWIEELEKRKFQRGVFIGLNVTNVKTQYYDFQLDEWTASHGDNMRLNSESKLKVANIRPFGKWYEAHFPAISTKYVIMQGIFSMEKQNIIQHDKTYYQSLVDELDGHSNPEVGHYMERSWGAVFHPIQNIDFLI